MSDSPTSAASIAAYVEGFLKTNSEEPIVEQWSFEERAKEQLRKCLMCERCKARPSAVVTRWGSIQAVCKVCAAKELADFNEETTPKPTGVNCPHCDEPYFLQTARSDSCAKCGYDQGY